MTNRKPINIDTDQLDIVTDQIEKPVGVDLPAIPACYLKQGSKVVHHCSEFADIETNGHQYLARYFFKLNRGVELNDKASKLQKAIYDIN